MKKSIILFFALFILVSSYAQLSKVTGVKWDESYAFEKCNSFKMEVYAKGNELRRTKQLKTYYQLAGEDFLVKWVAAGQGSGMETLIDKKNEVAIQIMGTGGTAKPYYSAGGFKYPAEGDLKKLELLPTTETKQICGVSCKKYTYTFKKIFGEVWITDQIKMPNDRGVFRACKMSALHNTLSVPGFVMEMTTEDSGGGRTLMTTLSLENVESYTIELKGAEITAAINKVNYYTF